MRRAQQLSLSFNYFLFGSRFDKLKYLNGKQEVEVDWHIQDLISGESVGGVTSFRAKFMIFIKICDQLSTFFIQINIHTRISIINDQNIMKIDDDIFISKK